MTSSALSSFQAHRYRRLGFPNLFSSVDDTYHLVLVVAIAQVELTAADLPAGWILDDAQRILRQMSHQLQRQHLVLVQPSAAERQQLLDDGLILHHSRRQLLECVINAVLRQDRLDRRVVNQLISLETLLKSGAVLLVRPD